MCRTKRLQVIFLACLLSLSSFAAASASDFEAVYLSATGWVEPGETFPLTLSYTNDTLAAGTVSLVLSEYTVFDSATPPPTGGAGTAADPLTWSVAPGTGKIIVTARAFTLAEEPTMIWRDLSASASLQTATEILDATTLGPKCTELSSARYGVRRFPLVMVEYQDITHCTGEGTPFPECTGDHTAEKLDEAVNSRTSGRSMWQLFTDMSFGQLSPEGQVGPPPGTADEMYDPSYPYRWSQLQPSGTCTGVTTAPPSGEGVPLSPRGRIEDGWYVLPGTQAYYGADATGHGLVGFVSGGLLLNIDDACGPTGKIAYDAAAIADPDLDYNEFDSDRDGLVDFMNVAFAGDGGNGNVTPTGINNVWPHKSDLQFYFIDENGQRGYVSNDQLRNHVDELMYWTDSSRTEMTTTNTGIPVYVRVGPYNVNPESAIDAVSVVAHEYGHSLGLPDFYSFGSRETFGSWELMASDHFQFMTAFTRQDMGWIVPRPAVDGVHTLQESKTDTGVIHWETEDGTPYALSGPGIHNADVLKVDLPKVLVIEEVPSGTRAWHSGSGNDFGCAPEAGHNLDVFLPDLANFAGASNVELSFQSLYEIEWDWDFAFLQVSTDGVNWQALPSLENTTLDGFNPNGWDCYDTYGHGITGVSRQATAERNLLTNPDRFDATYREAEWITDRFDLTQFAGEELIIRFSYFTDPAVAKRGWFIDDIAITADGAEVYASDFEDDESERLFSSGWAHVSTSTGRDVDHAYYIEVRDRISNDFDSKGESDRGPPTWQPGVAILYTDENHGYGNTGVDNPPAQTIVDSTPDPGNDTPNLDDAAFVPETGRDVFDGCTHVDNYDNDAGSHPDGYWKLPEGLRMTVSHLSGLSTDGMATGYASAELLIDVDPDCSFLQEPPILSFGAGHQDPDPDGSYELTWERPAAAIGPDTLQEATFLADLFTDDAESGMGNWTVATYADGCSTAPGDFVEWQQNSGKVQSPVFSFFTVASEAAYGATCADFHSTMTTAQPITIPATGGTVISFWDSFGGELDDKGTVDVSTDGGASWTEVYQVANPVFADGAIDFLEQPMKYREADLSEFAGNDVLVRFHYTVGASNYIAYTPIGWWVDDIAVSTANWMTVTETTATSYTRMGLTDGTYHYRAKTSFPGSPVPVESPWSNVVSTDVLITVTGNEPDAVDDEATTYQDQSVTIDVLANDSDPNGDDISVQSVQSPSDQGGTVTDNGDGTVTYSPPAGFVGEDTFTYQVCDEGGLCDTAQVTVTVLEPDDGVFCDLCAQGKPSEIELTYRGGSCSEWDNTQGSKASCEDFAGPPPSSGSVYILATNKEDADYGNAREWFRGSVDANETFELMASNADKDDFGSKFFVHVFAEQGGELLQTVEIHSSCSAPLFEGERFGSIETGNGQTSMTCEAGSSGRVHGSGYLTSLSGEEKINFSFDAKFSKDELKGKLKLKDKEADVKIDAKQIDSLSTGDGTCNGQATGAGAFEFTATGTYEEGDVEIEGATFRVCGEDNGKHGKGTATQPPDRLYIECLTGCSYDTAARTADDGIDGGNIHLHDAIGNNGNAVASSSASSTASSSSASSASGDPGVLELDPLLLSSGVSGETLLLTARLDRPHGEEFEGIALTLHWQVGDITGTVPSVTDGFGEAIFAVVLPTGLVEFWVTADELDSNRVELVAVD